MTFPEHVRIFSAPQVLAPANPQILGGTRKKPKLVLIEQAPHAPSSFCSKAQRFLSRTYPIELLVCYAQSFQRGAGRLLHVIKQPHAA